MAFFYADFVKKIAERFDAALAEIEVEHNFEYGDEFEIAICKTLRRVLPHKFGICRGYVVSRDGRVAGDDIIVYERLRFPTLRAVEGEFGQKERVPVEAVFAYIEAKHTLQLLGDGPSSLQKAIQQINQVRAVCSEREPVPTTQITPTISVNVPVQSPKGFPAIRNPLYTMVFGRQVRRENRGEVMSNPREIESTLMECVTGGQRPPDFVLAGASHVALPAILKNGPPPSFVSPFLTGDAILMGRTSPMITFGVAVSHLLWALDWIDLGRMPWNHIIANGLGYTDFHETGGT